MNVTRLQDRIYWGLNRAANVLGQPTDAYRPSGIAEPLDRSNRYLRLHAAFSRADGNFAQPFGYGNAMCRGYFDGAYTRVGDYLVQDNAIWFVAEQQSMLPVLCVRTNRVISISRQRSPQTQVSSDPLAESSTLSIISNWPASVLGIGTDGKSQTQLPADTRIPSWIALLPSVHNQSLQPTDILVDEFGASGIVVAAEISNLGWRLNVRQVTV